MTSVSVSVTNLWPSAVSCLLEGQIVFDDAVVDDDDFAGAIAVGMRVFFGRTPVCGPAGMADAVRPGERLVLDDLFEVAEFAFGAADV